MIDDKRIGGDITTVMIGKMKEVLMIDDRRIGGDRIDVMICKMKKVEMIEVRTVAMIARISDGTIGVRGAGGHQTNSLEKEEKKEGSQEKMTAQEDRTRVVTAAVLMDWERRRSGSRKATHR